MHVFARGVCIKAGHRRFGASDGLIITMQESLPRIVSTVSVRVIELSALKASWQGRFGFYEQRAQANAAMVCETCKVRPTLLLSGSIDSAAQLLVHLHLLLDLTKARLPDLHAVRTRLAIKCTGPPSSVSLFKTQAFRLRIPDST